jgi:predicted porin
MAYDLGYSTSGATAANSNLANRQRVVDDSSRIGFRISEDLGGGLRAFSVIETGINLDTGSNLGQGGGANTGSGFFGTREAHVGIGNATGEIRLGRQNVFWANGAIEDVSANRISGGVISSYTSPSSGFTQAPATRQDNTVQLIGGAALGAFAGSSVWISRPGVYEQTAVNVTPKAAAQGITLAYNQGPFAARLDYGQNKDTNNGLVQASPSSTAGHNATHTGTKLGLAYTYAPGSKVYFINAKFKSAFSVDAVNTQAPTTLGNTLVGGREQASNSIGVQHLMGVWELHGQVVKQGDVKRASGATLADSGSSAYSLGARYNLSKRTAITASYNVINNEALNNITASGAGMSQAGAGAGLAAGSDTKITRVSIQHAF